MVELRRLDSSAPGFDAALALLTAPDSPEDAGVETVVAAILADVRARGDAAVLEHTKRFDGVDAPSVAALAIPARELAVAFDSLATQQREALATAALRIRAFHERQRAEAWVFTEADG